MAETGSQAGRSVRTGVVMDPIDGITIYKDSTFAMLLEAQRRGHDLMYMEPADLEVVDGRPVARMRALRVTDDPAGWFELEEAGKQPLGDLDIVLMRRDPPFDMDYVYLTYILEMAQDEGALVVNRPQSLRDANEKFFIARFPQCCTPFVITRHAGEILEFVREQGKSVVKPLDGMGGTSIFQLNPGDDNLKVILETITGENTELVMAQKYIPEISAGDKRILVVDGEAVPYALARLPGAGDFRGNLARGGRGEGVALNDRDYWIVEQVAPELRQRGILFAGLDVIGDWLTEVNVTSPTCIRELDTQYGLNIAGQMFDVIENKLS
jgi:glutathione synthase